MSKICGYPQVRFSASLFALMADVTEVRGNSMLPKHSLVPLVIEREREGDRERERKKEREREREKPK